VVVTNIALSSLPSLDISRDHPAHQTLNPPRRLSVTTIAKKTVLNCGLQTSGKEIEGEGFDHPIELFIYQIHFDVWL